ncbi:hypothetical protein [uncultured Intestinimonas sp.]|uniref:hypothetical protein n=1 Tax=uncultured Intestinimonas sp. TaxID=1689265 RepID=UPI0025CF1D41|nr:hypothetical protein [uncultured Intestinimonas sp.]
MESWKGFTFYLQLIQNLSNHFPLGHGTLSMWSGKQKKDLPLLLSQKEARARFSGPALLFTGTLQRGSRFLRTRVCLKNSNVPSGEEFWVSNKQFFTGIGTEQKENRKNPKTLHI